MSTADPDRARGPDPTRSSSWGYLDAASGHPLHPAARDVLLEAHAQGAADAGRLHGPGRRARMLLDNAREVVAAVIGAHPDEVAFTASGTRARHDAVLGVAASARSGGRTSTPVVASAVEHSSVLHAVDHLGPAAPLHTLPVDSLGRVDLTALTDALAADPVLVAVQAANLEVGTRQPVPAVADVCRAASVPLLTDVTGLLGRGPVPDGWSVLTASAADWGGPAGVGVLAVRRGTRWRAPGPEEDELAATAHDVPGAVAAATALAAVVAEADAVTASQHALVARLRAEVARTVPDVEIVGDPEDRLPHVLTFSCLYADGESLVSGLDRHGFAVTSGSACSSSTRDPSHVLAAMGRLTHGNVRVSLRQDTGPEEVAAFLAVLPGVVADARAAAGAAGL